MATPAATFLGAFQAADSSARDWQRLALAQQQQANAMAQQLVENKKAQQAQDFNQMLALMKREDDTSQFEQQNSRLWAAQNSQDILGNYNAVTGRMGAATSRYNQILDARRLQQQQQYNDDPLGVMGGASPSTTEPALPSIPSIDDPQGGPLFNFGGRTYGQDWGPATATVFGGQNDPEDNGLSAFGGPTGSGGREGVAIPAKVLQQTIGGTKSDWERAGAEVTLADGTKTVLPIADLGTAERIWERNQGPTLDLTPGAVGSLGGAVITDRNGRQTGVRLPSQIANVRVVPDFQQASGSAAAPSPPDLSLPQPELTSGDPGPVPVPDPFNLGIPTPPAATAAPELPSASAVPTPPASFVGDDLTGQVSQQMRDLRREAELQKRMAGQANQMAGMWQAAAGRIRGNPVNQAAYMSVAEQYRQKALESGVAAAEAKIQAQQLAKDEAEIRKGQQEIAKLASLTGVLPDADVAQIKELAANPLSTGYRETITKTLTDYDEVRKDQGLNYRSNGYATAERVALAGKRLEKNRKDMESFDKLQSLQASLAAAGDDPKAQKTIKGKIEDAKPGAERWQRLKGEFDAAVKADIRAEPTPDVPAGTASTPAAAPAGPPADDWLARANALIKQDSKTTDMPIQEQQKWSQAKDAVSNFLGGERGIIQEIADYGKADRGEIQTLDKLKRALTTAVMKKVTAARQKSGSGLVERLGNPQEDGDVRVSPQELGLNGLPMNARSIDSVVEALAEDIWTKRMGRNLNSAATPNSPGISAPLRGVFENILSKKDKTAAQ